MTDARVVSGGHVRRALHIPGRDRHREKRLAGSVWFSAVGDAGSQAMWFYCPCGCGMLSRIEIGAGAKPDSRPSWRWNGRMDAPTLTPSVRQAFCGWHGWLRMGYWEVC